MSKLNPRNSFFGRIFVWFWLVTLSSIGTGVLVAMLFTPAPEYSSPTTTQLIQIERLAARLKRIQATSPDEISKRLRQLGAVREVSIFLIDKETQNILFGFPAPARPQSRLYLDLLDEQEPVIVTRGNTRFLGPVSVTIANRDYALFAGTTRFRSPSRIALISIVVVVAVFVSGALCYLLARSFSRPLHEIKTATESLASGDLTSRVNLSQTRQDEFQALSASTNRMAEQLERLFGEHQRFLADVSHELRSPLTRLQLAVGIAEQQGGDATQGGQLQIDQRIVERIVKEADQMESMIAQLLWLSKIESSQHEHPFTLMDGSEMVTGLLNPLFNDIQFEATSLDKTFTTNAPLPASGIHINIQSEVLLSAIENVCRNALKYADSQVQVDLLWQKERLIIAIQDDGPGVDASELSLLFKPFYRTDQSRTRDTGGVGLGLSIAQRAIERHGGNITADLVAPHGLRVSIELPIGDQLSNVAANN